MMEHATVPSKHKMFRDTSTLFSILVGDQGSCLGQFSCYSKIPQTGWLMNSLFLTALSLKAQDKGANMRSSFWVAGFSLCLHMVEGASGLSGVPFIRTLIPFMKGSTLIT